jgi:ACR3 family arsenite transporter
MQQATRFLDNIGLVFRVMVPLALYFVVMWVATFGVMWWLSRTRGLAQGYDYETAVVQAFTAASNNFELAIAVCVAVYGVASDQALAAAVGPLVEVPVLLALSYVALRLRTTLKWGTDQEAGVKHTSLV